MTLSETASNLIHYCMEIFFPIACLNCGKQENYLCVVCISDIPTTPPACFGCGKLSPPRKRTHPGRTCTQCQKKTNIYAYYSPYVFTSKPIRQAIAALKYRRMRPVADLLGTLISRYLIAHGVRFPQNSVLIPIPLHPKRHRSRGFNQSEQIAKILSKNKKIPLEIRILQKKHHTVPQVGLAAIERRQNIINTFIILASTNIQGKTVILVDDVKTTGATMEEAARVLKNAGARRIYAVTAAH